MCSNLVTLLGVAVVTLWAESVSALHECGSLFTNDVFRCHGERRMCLPTKELICREPLLAQGIYGKFTDDFHDRQYFTLQACKRKDTSLLEKKDIYSIASPIYRSTMSRSIQPMAWSLQSHLLFW